MSYGYFMKMRVTVGAAKTIIFKNNQLIFGQKMLNAHHYFPEMSSLNGLFCPTNAPKHKYSSLPAKMMKKDS